MEKILKHLYASVGTIGQQVADQLGLVSQGIAQIVQQDAEQLGSPFEPKHRQRRKNRRGRWFCGRLRRFNGRAPYRHEGEVWYNFTVSLRSEDEARREPEC